MLFLSTEFVLQIDIGKSPETVFGLSFQRDFQRQSLRADYDTNSTDRGEMIKASVPKSLVNLIKM